MPFLVPSMEDVGGAVRRAGRGRGQRAERWVVSGEAGGGGGGERWRRGEWSGDRRETGACSGWCDGRLLLFLPDHPHLPALPTVRLVRSLPARALPLLPAHTLTRFSPCISIFHPVLFFPPSPDPAPSLNEHQSSVSVASSLSLDGHPRPHQRRQDLSCVFSPYSLPSPAIVRRPLSPTTPLAPKSLHRIHRPFPSSSSAHG